MEEEKQTEEEIMQEEEMVTPGEVLGKAAEVKPGKGAYLAPYRNTEILYVYSSLTGVRRTLSPPADSADQVYCYSLPCSSRVCLLIFIISFESYFIMGFMMLTSPCSYINYY